MRDLQPVAHNLASPKTDLGGFFRGLEAFSGALAPVAQTQADLYTNLDTTFRAIAPVAEPYLRDWIQETPPTFSAVIRDSPRRAGVPAEHRRAVQGAAARLRDAEAERAGARRRVRHRDPDAAAHQGARRAAARACPSGSDATRRRRRSTAAWTALTLTVQSLRSPLAFLTPVQATCNYVSLFLRNTGSLLSEQFGNGTALRFNVVVIDDVLGGEAVPSSKPYLHEVPASSASGNNGESGPLHVNPYPYTASPGQPRECAAGNEPYTSGYADRQPARQPRHPHREDDEAKAVRRHRSRISKFAAGRDRDRRDRHRLLLRVRRLLAVRGHAVPAQGGVHVRDAAAHPLAGADRRASTSAR